MLGLRRKCKELPRKILTKLGFVEEGEHGYYLEAPLVRSGGQFVKGLGTLDEQEKAGLITQFRGANGQMGTSFTTKWFLETEAVRRQHYRHRNPDGFDRSLPMDHPDTIARAERLAAECRREMEEYLTPKRGAKPSAQSKPQPG